MLGVLAATQSNRLSPLVFLYIAVFCEKHMSGQIHYHIAVVADRCFRFSTMKKEFLRQAGLATHWSCTHDHYASCVAYGYLPSLKKQPEHLDPEPFTWASEGRVHPPLEQASRAPVTAMATAKRRENLRRANAAEGKSECRFKDVDLWPIVIQENIAADELAAERVMQYAKRCGGHAMVEYCFVNWDKLPALVARSWKVERVEDYVEQHSKTRIDILRGAAHARPAAVRLAAAPGCSLPGCRPLDCCPGPRFNQYIGHEMILAYLFTVWVSFYVRCTEASDRRGTSVR